VDTRIFGCSIAGSSADCSASEASFVDGNCVNYTMPGTASYSMLKAASGASCATIRAAIP
jgi:hypothetical protein